MKKRVFAILISVVIIFLGVFGVNVLLAQQSSKTIAANSAPKTEYKQLNTPAEVANANVPSNSAPPEPPTQNNNPQQKQITYDAISPAISPVSIEYMSSNYLNQDGNFNMESDFKKFVSEWTDMENNDPAHKKDSLINGLISFRGYVSKSFNPYPSLFVGLILPVDTVYGESSQVYDDTIHDLNSFANYLQNYTVLSGYYIYVEGKDGKKIAYQSDQNTLVTNSNPSSKLYSRNDWIWLPPFGLVWKASANSTSTPFNCPEIQSALPNSGKEICVKIEYLRKTYKPEVLDSLSKR